jgi:hypothetical protein
VLLLLQMLAQRVLVPAGVAANNGHCRCCCRRCRYCRLLLLLLLLMLAQRTGIPYHFLPLLPLLPVPQPRGRCQLIAALSCDCC